MFWRRHLKAELAPGNVPENWAITDAWREWEAPCNFVAGESFHSSQLRELTGKLREYGYLQPVEAEVIRERSNRYDANAWRVEVAGREVGHLGRHIAAQLAGALDRESVSSFRVCGLIRGGTPDAPNIGVHLWLGRRAAPGPEITQLDDGGQVPWPPFDSEGASSGPDDAGRIRNF
jgi:hypothetical protein